MHLSFIISDELLQAEILNKLIKLFNNSVLQCWKIMLT